MNNLTQQQLQAAHAPGAVVMCLAAAGSGKTRVLVERAEWLMRDCAAKASDICIVTFTSAAAKELIGRLKDWTTVAVIPHPVMVSRSERTAEMLPAGTVFTSGVRFGHCGTLHALLYKLLREHHALAGLPAELTVLGEDEAVERLAELAATLRVKAPMVKLEAEVTRVLETGNLGTSSKERIFAQEYVRQMRQSGELTFDAILHWGHRLLLEHPEVAPFRHLLWDEAQDGAVTDWRIFDILKCETKFAVGDDRQRIYSFRGASDGFERHISFGVASMFPLDTNFRSSRAVVAAGNALQPAHRPALPLLFAPSGSVSVVEYATAAEEVGAVISGVCTIPPNQTCAVLLRTNAAADRFKTALAPYGVARPTGQATADERLALLMIKAAISPCNDRIQHHYLAAITCKETADKIKQYAQSKMVSISKCINRGDVSNSVMNTGQDVFNALAASHSWTEKQEVLATSEMIAAMHIAAGWTSLLPLPCTLGELLLAIESKRETEPPKGRLFVGTIHSAKGLEFDHVWLPCCENEVLPGKKTGADLDEERRVLYVAVTRAKLTCTASWCRERPGDFSAWKMEKRTPCRWLADIGGGL